MNVLLVITDRHATTALIHHQLDAGKSLLLACLWYRRSRVWSQYQASRGGAARHDLM